MWSFNLRFHVYTIEKLPFSGTFPLIYGNPWYFYMRIRYMRIRYMRIRYMGAYLSHITRSTCISLSRNL